MSEHVGECNGCGFEKPESKTTCPHCGADKCNVCDMGDDVECANCASEDD